MVGDSLFCPTSEEFILPVDHGNDRCEWFVALSDEIIWDVKDKETGKHRARVVMKAGDVSCMPADIRHKGYADKRSMLLVWENASPKIPELIQPRARRPCVSVQLLMADMTKVAPLSRRARSRPACSSAANGSTARPAREIDVINPYDGRRSSAIAEAREADVDRAVEAAQAAAPGWARLAAHERGRLLLKLADRIEADADYLARLEAHEHRPPDPRLPATSTCRARCCASAISAAWPTSWKAR